MRKALIGMGSLSLMLFGFACEKEPVAKAKATIESKSSSSVAGTVTFLEVSDTDARVEVALTGLTPGKHGLHLHETGDCSAADGSSAGGHWNPDSTEHGAPDAAKHHTGDLGNVTAEFDGKATFTLDSKDFNFSGTTSVIGKAVIVHDKEDDLTTQPTGNAGTRIGCGVVQAL